MITNKTWKFQPFVIEFLEFGPGQYIYLNLYKFSWIVLETFWHYFEHLLQLQINTFSESPLCSHFSKKIDRVFYKAKNQGDIRVKKVVKWVESTQNVAKKIWRHLWAVPKGSDISGPMSISLNSTFNLLMTKRESYDILWLHLIDKRQKQWMLPMKNKVDQKSV